MKTRLTFLFAMVFALTPLLSSAQARQDPDALIASQRDAMQALAFMDGVWRGTATTQLPNGQKHSITQTERVGPMLDGSIKVIEGRGYDANGKVSFNAFAIASFNPGTRSYSLHSHAMGRAGDFELTPTVDGFVWKVPAGPSLTIRYTATFKDGTWVETGERLVPNQEPVAFFEMTLKRLGNSDWPMAGAVEFR